jgi:hypothetical protein
MAGTKRKKRKMIKQKKRVAPDQRPHEFIELLNPFSNAISDSDSIEEVIEAAASAANQFEDSMRQLTKTMQSVNILHLLSVLSFYGLTVPTSESGEMLESGLDEPFMQPQVELAQALALQFPIEQQSATPAGPDVWWDIWDLLKQNAAAYVVQRITQIRNAETPEEKAILLLQERLRNHTHFVRNWGFYRPVIRISRSLYHPLNQLYEDIVGLSATDIITVFEQLVAGIEARLSYRLQQFAPVFQATSVEGCVSAYYKVFPDMEGTPDEAIRVVRTGGASLDRVRQLLMTHADLRLPEIYTFSCSELASTLSLDTDRLERTLNVLSYRFGDLRAEDPSNFFLMNPVWMKPVIHLEADRYFCPMPQLFFSFVFRILEGLLAGDEKARKACQRRRSEFLEDEVAALFETAFRDTKPIRNFKWKDGQDEYETDLIVPIDSYLILVEAKSHSVSWPALRGAPKRAKRHIQELIVDPSMQSSRLLAKLLELNSGDGTASEPPRILPFDVKTIKKVVRLSVTLEDFATIQSNVMALKETGWLDAELRPAPTITLADLEIVFDILTDTPEKLHYWVRRAELEEHLTYFGDELDLLGLYLETGFNIGKIEYGQHPLVITNKSKATDDYYDALDRGHVWQKPVLESTKLWLDMRRALEKIRNERWSEAAVMLLSMSYKDQQNVEDRFGKIVNETRSRRSQPYHNNVLILRPEFWQHDAFAMVAYREESHENRYKLVDSIWTNFRAEEQTTRCLVIGVNVDRDEHPFSFLSVTERAMAPEG